MFYPPATPTTDCARPAPGPLWHISVAKPETSEALRERAYRLARQELPDAPVEDVICRAETIASYLTDGKAPRE